MSIWDEIQKDLKESLSVFKDGSNVITEKLEKLTDDGKKKFKVFNMNMKIQEEFANLGGKVYELISENAKNPLTSSKVTPILKKIQKLEDQINKLEDSKIKKPAVKKKTTAKKKTTTKKTTTKKKTIAKKKVTAKKQTTKE